MDELAAKDLDGLNDVALAERVLTLRRLVDRLEGHWLKELAAVDARGAAGADQDQQVGSTAAWLRNRLRLGAGAAQSAVRTARALFRGPLTGTAAALANGELSVAHAAVVAHGTRDLPDHSPSRPNRSWSKRLVGWTRPGCDGFWAICGWSPTPTASMTAPISVMPAGGYGWRRPSRGWSPSTGCWSPRPARPSWPPWSPWPAPPTPTTPAAAANAHADALAELARRALEGGRLPQTGGVRPQLTVTVDLDSLLGRHHAAWWRGRRAGPLDPEACQRLACDSAVTRVLVTRHPTTDHEPRPPLDGPGPIGTDPPARPSWARRARAGAGCGAVALLPPVLGGAPAQPLEVGRASRVVQAAQRTALAVRDGGCVFPGCDRPLAWCEAHHLRHWLHGGPTDLANLALLCRAHHRAVHEGGWRLHRHPDGQLTAVPPHRRHRAAA